MSTSSSAIMKIEPQLGPDTEPVVLVRVEEDGGEWTRVIGVPPAMAGGIAQRVIEAGGRAAHKALP